MKYDIVVKLKISHFIIADKINFKWMHDISVVGDLKADFTKKTLADCEAFIQEAQNTRENLHLAVVNDEDKYMGTVSLKHINGVNAEFGIVVSKAAMGQGYSGYAMREILRIAFEKMQLNEVFWCVSRKNQRAVRFYDKNGYQRVDGKSLDVCNGYSKEEMESYLWYQTERT